MSNSTANHQESITESQILTSYLIHPAPLPTFLPYTDFLKLLPAAYRNHANIKGLYRALQLQRNVDIDNVRENIERERRKEPSLKGRLRATIEHDREGSRNPSGRGERKRKRSQTQDHDNDDDDGDEARTHVIVEDEFSNSQSHAIDAAMDLDALHPAAGTGQARRSDYHTLPSLLDAMDAAVATLESELVDLESYAQHTLAHVTEAVGALSDLRYGRFAQVGDQGQASFEDGLVQDLKGFVKVIKNVDR